MSLLHCLFLAHGGVFDAGDGGVVRCTTTASCDGKLNVIIDFVPSLRCPKFDRRICVLSVCSMFYAAYVEVVWGTDAMM